MTHPRHLALILLGLLLTAAPLQAQTDATQTSAAAPDSGSGEKSAATQQTPAATEPAPGGSPGTSNSSPFDYRASEQISEDLPVSFPVDI
ncbi:Uncharacterised protein [Halioglobus japonicus]|nr:Uncharacterised protein [Halioglobus japonicus]